MADAESGALEFDWASAGEDALAAKLDMLVEKLGKLGVVTKTVDAETAKTAATTARAAGSVADAGAKWNSFNGAIGLVARGIGTQNAALGQMISTIGQGAASIGTMSVAMGPLGIALGVATTAFSLYEQHVASTRAETDRLRESTARAKTQLDDLIAAQRDDRARHERDRRIATNTTTPEETAALLETRQVERGMAMARALEQRGENQRQARRRVAQLDAEIAQMEAMARFMPVGGTGVVPSSPRPEARTRRGGGGGRGAPSTLEPWEDAGPGRTFGAGSAAMAGVGRDVAAERAAAEAERAKDRESLQGHQRYLDARAELDEAAQKERLRALDELAERERSVREEQMRGYQMVSGIAIDSLQGILASDKAHLAETMKNMGIGYGWKAVGELAAALGTQFIPGFQAEAAGHWASFGVYAAAAGALGAGAAVAGGGGGGGGGGASQGTARPEGGGNPSQQQRGPTVYNVFNGPVIAAGSTELEAGRSIGRVIRRADERYGRS